MGTKVVLMSGVPGSGKSTYVRKNYPDAKVCSADRYFTDADGVYRFNPAMLGEAHAACMKQFIDGLEDEVPTVVVDNTNTTDLELAPYVAVAAAFKAEVEIVTVLCSPETAHARNVHGVPLAAIRAMTSRIHNMVLPPFWNISEDTIYTD